MWTISSYIVLWLWNSGPWCLVCLGCSGLCRDLWWIFPVVWWGIGGGIVLSWYGRWFHIVWFGVFGGNEILIILRILNDLLLSSSCFSSILYLIGCFFYSFRFGIDRSLYILISLSWVYFCILWSFLIKFIIYQKKKKIPWNVIKIHNTPMFGCKSPKGI